MDRDGFGRRLITGVLLFVLLSEWMRPLAHMSEVTGIFMLEPLLLTLAALMATDVLRLPAALSWTIKILVVLSLPAMVYGRTSLVDSTWWSGFVGKLAQDASHMLSMEWGLISAELRTFFFVMSWAIVASGLFMAVSYTRFALWFTAGTAAYLLLLSWWPGLDTFPGLLRATGVGLLLHAFQVPSVLLRRHGMRANLARVPIVWPLSVMLASSLALGAGYLMSAKFGDTAPARSLPVWESIGSSFAKLGAGSKWLGKMSAGRTGYGPDDSTLGGSLRSDPAPAFLAVTAGSGRYFRGEAKTIYDGKGWHGRDNDEYHYEIGAALPNVMEGAMAVSVDPSYDAVRYEAADADAEVEIVYLMDEEWLARLNADGLTDQVNRKAPGLAGQKGRSPIFASGAVVRMEAARSAAMLSMEEGAVAVDRLEGNYRLTGLKQPLSSYRMLVHEAGEFDRSALSESEEAVALQLPDELPERVRRLAERIAAPHDSTYEKAKAIENYLKEHYEYTLDPPKVKGDGDFVDRFLFMQKVGYCDYFSTAMAVMLRSVGIPARWVKGFAPGEPFDPERYALLAERMAVIEQGELPEAMHYSLVRSSDAHSWVEAHIPGQGWTPFEPTPGIGGGGAASPDSGMASDSAAVPALAQLEPGSVSGDNWAASIRNQAASLGKTAIGGLVMLTDAAMMLRKLSLEQALSTASLLRIMPERFLAAVIMLGMLIAAALWLARSGKIGLRLRFVAYALGLGGTGADARLLERILVCELQGKAGTNPGETMREAATRHSTGARGEPFAAIELYERLRFGPPGGTDRLPVRKLLAAWKSVKEWRNAVRPE